METFQLLGSYSFFPIFQQMIFSADIYSETLPSRSVTWSTVGLSKMNSLFIVGASHLLHWRYLVHTRFYAELLFQSYLALPIHLQSSLTRHLGNPINIFQLHDYYYYYYFFNIQRVIPDLSFLVPSEQFTAINCCAPVMWFIPPSVSGSKQVTAFQMDSG